MIRIPLLGLPFHELNLKISLFEPVLLALRRSSMEHKHAHDLYPLKQSDSAKIPGWLEQKPKLKDINPSLVIYLLCILCTGFARHPAIPQGLWVSGESIFSKQEYWRLFTALLVHGDWGHLLANSPLLLIFSWYLRTYFGLILFPLVSIAAGMLTNLITIWFYPPGLRLVGASGMVYAMVAMWLVFYMSYEVRFTRLARAMRAIGFALVLMAPTSFSPRTSYLAHGVGFGIGALIALLAIPLLKTPRFLPRELWTKGQAEAYHNSIALEDYSEDNDEYLGPTKH